MEKLASTKQKAINVTANYAFKLTTVSPIKQGIVINSTLCSLTGELISHCEIPCMGDIDTTGYALTFLYLSQVSCD